MIIARCGGASSDEVRQARGRRHGVQRVGDLGRRRLAGLCERQLGADRGERLGAVVQPITAPITSSNAIAVLLARDSVSIAIMPSPRSCRHPWNHGC